MKKKIARIATLCTLPLLLCGCSGEKVAEQVTRVNNAVNDFVWVKIGLFLLLGTGVLMTVLTKFFQITHIGHWMKKTIGSIFSKHVSGHVQDKSSISQFQALCTALAAPSAWVISPALRRPLFPAGRARCSGCGLRPFSE